MKDIPSAEFRKTYPRLVEPVAVTVLGRVIGHYVPVGIAIDDRFVAGLRPGEPASPGVITETHVWTNAHDSDDVIRKAWSRSQPAPKTRKGG